MPVINTEALVEPLARAICAERDGRCTCAEGRADYRIHCDDAERSARVALAHLLPILVERCAEEAVSYCKGMPRVVADVTAMEVVWNIEAAIRSLIPTPAKGGA